MIKIKINELTDEVSSNKKLSSVFSSSEEDWRIPDRLTRSESPTTSLIVDNLSDSSSSSKEKVPSTTFSSSGVFWKDKKEIIGNFKIKKLKNQTGWFFGEKKKSRKLEKYRKENFVFFSR